MLEPGGGWAAIILAALAVATPGLQLELPLRVEDGLLLLLFGPEIDQFQICQPCMYVQPF